MNLLPLIVGSALLSAPASAVPTPSESPAQEQVSPHPAQPRPVQENPIAKRPAISFGDYLSGRFAESSGDTGNSVKYLRESLARDPGNKDILYNLYVALLDTGDITEAVKIAKKLGDAKLPDDTGEFPPSFLLAMEAARNGAFPEAQRYLQSLPRTGFNSILLPLLDAWLKLGEGEVKAPFAAKDMMPNGKMLLAHIYLNAALINEIAGFGPQAAEQYETAVRETRLESQRAAEALENYYARNGLKEKFREFASSYTANHGETIIGSQVFPSLPPPPLVTSATEGVAEALYTVASIFHGVRSPADEIITLKIALYIRPDFPAAQFLLANAYEMTRGYRQAIESYKHIWPESPYYLQSRILMAYDQSEGGDKENAMAQLDAIAADKPDSVLPLLAKGDILRTGGNFAGAVMAYDAALTRIKTVKRPQWIIYFSRGVCYDRLGNSGKAEADMQKALEVSPGEPDALNYLGYSWLAKRHNIPQAKKMIEEAYEARPEDPQIIDSMGYALYMEGDYASAREYFEQALERIPDDPTVNEHLGDTYWQLGRKTEAGYQWQRALDDKPEEENRKALLKKLESGIPPGSSAAPQEQAARTGAAQEPKAPAEVQ